MSMAKSHKYILRFVTSSECGTKQTCGVLLKSAPETENTHRLYVESVQPLSSEKIAAIEKAIINKALVPTACASFDLYHFKAFDRARSLNEALNKYHSVTIHFNTYENVSTTPIPKG